MAEDQIKTEPSLGVPLHNPSAARESIKRSEIKKELVGKTKAMEGVSPTLTPANITSEQVGRIAGKLYNEGLKRDPGVTERFTRLVGSAKTEEETAKVNREQEQKLAEDIAKRFKQKQEEEFYPPVVAPSQTPPPPRPFTPTPVSRQTSQTPAAVEQKGGIGGFFRRLFNK